MIARKGLVLGLIAALAIASLQAASGAEPRSPADVHTALRILASVYADMESKLPDQLDRLAHENQEFHDGSQAMRDAMSGEPAHYKARVLAALDKAVNDSQQVADISQTHDTAKVKGALGHLAASMRALNALFPASLRAEPGSVPAPHHGGPR